MNTYRTIPQLAKWSAAFIAGGFLFSVIVTAIAQVPSGVAIRGITPGTPDLLVSAPDANGVVTTSSTVPTPVDLTGSGTAILTSHATKTLLLGAHTYTLAQAGTTGFAAGWGVCLSASGAATINATTSIFGNTSNATSLVMAAGDFVCISSDGTNYPSLGGHWTAGTGDATLAGTQTFTGNKTFSGANTYSGVGTFTGTVIGSNLDLSATGAISLGAPCGKHVRYTGGSNGTLTINSAEVANCAFDVEATSTGLATIAASGGSFHSNTACTATPRTKEAGSVIWVKVSSNAGSAPVVVVSGDCG